MNDALSRVRTSEVQLHGDLTSFGLGRVMLDAEEVIYLVRHAASISGDGVYRTLAASLDGAEYEIGIQVSDRLVWVHSVKER